VFTPVIYENQVMTSVGIHCGFIAATRVTAESSSVSACGEISSGSALRDGTKLSSMKQEPGKSYEKSA
jgi:hypothetical protein